MNGRMDGQVAEAGFTSNMDFPSPKSVSESTSKKRGSWVAFTYVTAYQVGTLGPQDRKDFLRGLLGREGPAITSGPLAPVSGLPWSPRRPPSLV